MGVLGFQRLTGLAGVTPNLIFINTNDTPATIVTAGYLNTAVQMDGLQVSNNDMALVNCVIAGVSFPKGFLVSTTGTLGSFSFVLVSLAVVVDLRVIFFPSAI